MAEYITSPETGTGARERRREREKTRRPRRFKVILLNDHYTTMDFVVMVLEQVFRKPSDEAVRIMLNVHENGMGVAGVYVKAVAELKVETVHKLAQEYGHPLRCGMEPE